jgi:hypothetical protein
MRCRTASAAPGEDEPLGGAGVAHERHQRLDVGGVRPRFLKLALDADRVRLCVSAREDRLEALRVGGVVLQVRAQVLGEVPREVFLVGLETRRKVELPALLVPVGS